jgi:dienelactone hydrolase
VLVAYVCTKDQRSYLTDIKEYIGMYLPAYMIPTFWNHVKEFSLNLNGKIDKSQLSNTADELTTNTTPLTNEEEILMRAVACTLGLNEVNVDADLMEDFGLTSLQLMNISTDLAMLGYYVESQEIARFRTVRNILKNTNSPDHYWYNDDDTTTKPVIICISGFVGFSFMYTQMMDRLTDRFSIYVVEAYQPIIGPDRYATTDELMDMYIERIQHVIDNHKIVAFTGVCYGGEQALYLAHRLYHDKPYKPAVVCLDGEVDRDITPENNPVTYFPFFSEEQNKHRTEQDYILQRTLPDFVYQGKVVTFICSVFVDCYSYLDPNPSEYKVDCMKAALASSPARWKHRYPDCEVVMYPAQHDTFWRTEPSITMTADCFNRIYDELTTSSEDK